MYDIYGYFIIKIQIIEKKIRTMDKIHRLKLNMLFAEPLRTK